MKLISPKFLEIRESQIHGWGIFALNMISKGTIIEECLMIPCLDSNTAFNMRFKWPNSKMWSVIVLGFGSLYNHSQNPNVEFEIDEKLRLCRFRTTRQIERDEECTIDYGNDWWITREKIGMGGLL